MIVATTELVDCRFLVAIPVYIEAGQFEQHVVATIARVHYIPTFSLFHMQQPYECLLAIVLYGRVHTGQYEPFSVDLQESFTQHLIASRRGR